MDDVILILNTEASIFHVKKRKDRKDEKKNGKPKSCFLFVFSTVLAKELCSALLLPQGAPLILATRDVMSGLDSETSDMSSH
jgi:hypothetical protein